MAEQTEISGCLKVWTDPTYCQQPILYKSLHIMLRTKLFLTISDSRPLSLKSLCICTLFTAVLFFVIGSETTIAFDKEDFLRLKSTNSCPSCDLRNANLNWTDFHGANLAGADLRKAQMVAINLRGANVSGANFAEANLLGASLTDAIMHGASFYKTNLRAVGMNNTDLRGIDFRGAVLVGTQFDNADLSGADLRRAWLYHGDLSKSNLNGTDLSTTKVWYHQIQKAILCNTKSRFWGVINSGCVAM